MKNLQNILITVALAMGLFTTQIFTKDSLEKEELTTNSKIQVLDKKISGIEKQIAVLESKGVENLSDEEFTKLDILQDQLLTAMKTKTAQQKVIIAEEKEKQKAYDRINETLKSIQGTLSSKDLTK